jgi:tetratricopeptide (TPR) repeat protein
MSTVFYLFSSDDRIWSEADFLRFCSACGLLTVEDPLSLLNLYNNFGQVTVETITNFFDSSQLISGNLPNLKSSKISNSWLFKPELIKLIFQPAHVIEFRKLFTKILDGKKLPVFSDDLNLERIKLYPTILSKLPERQEIDGLTKFVEILFENTVDMEETLSSLLRFTHALINDPSKTLEIQIEDFLKKLSKNLPSLEFPLEKKVASFLPLMDWPIRLPGNNSEILIAQELRKSKQYESAILRLSKLIITNFQESSVTSDLLLSIKLSPEILPVYLEIVSLYLCCKDYARAILLMSKIEPELVQGDIQLNHFMLLGRILRGFSLDLSARLFAKAVNVMSENLSPVKLGTVYFNYGSVLFEIGANSQARIASEVAYELLKDQPLFGGRARELYELNFK